MQPLPEVVRGLVVTVKEYERMTMRAAVTQVWDTAALALTISPIIGNWHSAGNFPQRLAARDHEHFAGFSRHDILHS